jgi:hypothetical protein
MQWRDMTVAEIATRPEAKLGGALLAIDVIAVVLCGVVLTGIIALPNEYRALGIRYGLAVAFITLWSGAFVIMTWLRMPSTPVAASTGLFLWILYRSAVSVAGSYGGPLAVDLLAELAMAAGFCGYMVAGVRPNAYYRRRLPAVWPL